MKIKPISLLVLIFLLLPANTIAAQVPVKPDYQKSQSDYEKIQHGTAGLIELKGEVTAIGPTEIMINTSIAENRFCQVRLTPETKIFCNGSFSRWEALNPVAPGAYFEARLLMNNNFEAVAVDAFYYGEECLINKWHFKNGLLMLNLSSVCSAAKFSYPVNREARLPSTVNWLQEGQVVFVLYNRDKEIRAIFLPD